MRRILGCALLLAACGDGNGDTDEPQECRIEDCVGTYLVTYDMLGGDCGTVDPRVINASDPLDPVGPGCVANTPTRYSSDWCSVEQDLLCTSADGATTRVVGTVEQEPGCNLARGIATFDVTYNGLSCSGTYRLTYVRQ